MLYLYSKCVFCGEIEMHSALWVRFTFCASRPSLGAKSGLADDFPQKFFHITPPRNGNVGWGHKEFPESGFFSWRKFTGA